ncbi:MAG: gamma-glutamylcyclotransferase [Gemmatimonadaceae bacterium]|nr:gamma-glutamylcyclotransferase [Gloeobacterales cyanobacterium ES-bin-141]
MSHWQHAGHVWVYGTLRAGECNHGLLRGRSELVRSSTRPGRLYSVQDCYPVLQLDQNAQPVTGELYQIAPRSLKSLGEELDRLEGIDEGYYRAVLVQELEGPCVIYVGGEKLLPYCEPRYQIAEGDWCRYRPAGLRSKDEHLGEAG